MNEVCQDCTGQCEMPRYQSHKQVWALKIKAIRPVQGGNAIITPAEEGYTEFGVPNEWLSRYKSDGKDFGYYVVYKGGYTSWSPTKAFEEGYTRI